MADALSPFGAMVRRHDPDRFLTALFAPAERREALFLLYAFNHELARAREVVSEPMLALMRLQWWREVVEGAQRRHEVAAPLGVALADGVFDRGDLLAMIEGREMEAEPTVPTLAAWRDFLGATAGGVAVAAGRMLGADAAALARLRGLGAAYGAAQMLRNVGALARRGRCLLPEDFLQARGLSMHEVVARPGDAVVRAARVGLAVEAGGWLEEAAGQLARPVLAAGLVGTLARRDLQRLAPPGPRGVADRLAVTSAALRGRP